MNTVEQYDKAKSKPLESGLLQKLSPNDVNRLFMHRRSRSTDVKKTPIKTNTTTDTSSNDKDIRKACIKVSPSKKAKTSNHVVINVGGQRFQTYRSTLAMSSHSRLYSIVKDRVSTTDAEYDSIRDEFFIDRDPVAFAQILDYYRTGKLHIPLNICGPRFEDELLFWGIDSSYLEPCCLNHYRTFRDAQKTLMLLKDADNEYSADSDEICCNVLPPRRTTAKTRRWRWLALRMTLWEIFEGTLYTPEYSLKRKVVAIISMSLLLLSVFMIEFLTSVYGRKQLEMTWRGLDYMNISRSNFSVSAMLDNSKPKPLLIYIDFTVSLFFIVELILRIIAAPCIILFITNPLNWIDVCSNFLSVVFFVVEVTTNNTATSAILLLAPRILRLFKFTKHLRGLKILVLTMKASWQELLLLLVLFTMFVLVWGMVLFVVEEFFDNSNNPISSVGVGFWWALSTMSTVGYGDVVPSTAFGKIIAYMCTLCGVVVVALPIPVIVNNFALYYSQAQVELFTSPQRSSSSFHLQT